MAQLKVEELSPAGERVRKQCEGIFPPAEVRVGEGGWALPRAIVQHIDKIKNMEVRPTDVWVVSYPKTGTTWTQEMVWVLGNNCDFDAARARPIYDRFMYAEFEFLGINLPKEKGRTQTFDFINNFPRDKPRYLRSHLPLELLPTGLLTVKPKIIFVTREPKDTIISNFHHHKNFRKYVGSFEDFLDSFLADEVLFGPFWRTTLDMWALRDHENVLFLTYEEMKKDLRRVVRRTADFLGSKLPEHLEDAVITHLSFETMKNNSAVNHEGFIGPVLRKDDDREKIYFMREGKSGGWKNFLTPAQVDKIDAWSRQWMEGSSYPYTA